MNIICSMTIREMEIAKEHFEKAGFNTVLVNFGKLYFSERPYTEEEKKWADDNLRIGYEGLCKVKGQEPMKVEVNKYFKEDCDKYLSEVLNDDANKDAIIFVNYNAHALKYFDDNKIWYTLIYPDNKLKAEYIGREFIHAYENKSGYTKVELITSKWDDIINHFERKDSTTCNKVILGQNDTLVGAITNLIKETR